MLEYETHMIYDNDIECYLVLIPGLHCIKMLIKFKWLKNVLQM